MTALKQHSTVILYVLIGRTLDKEASGSLFQPLAQNNLTWTASELLPDIGYLSRRKEIPSTTRKEKYNETSQ